MTQNSVLSVILRFSLDEASQRRVLKGIGDVEQVLSQTRRRVVSVEDAAAGMNAEFAELARAKAIDNLTADAIKAAKATDNWESSLKGVAEQLSLIGASDDEIKQVARTLAGTQSGGRGGRGQNGNIETVDRLGSVGSQLLSGLGQGELANVAGIVGDVAGGIGSLGVAGIAAAGALGAVSIAMSEYNRQLDQQKGALRGALDAQDRYYQALNTFTSAQAAQEIETESARLENLRRQRGELQNAIDSAFAQAQSAFGDPLARALDASGQLPTAQLREQLRELDAQITSTDGYVVRLSDGLRNLEFSSQDTADAVARAIEQNEKFQEIQTRTQLNEVQLQVRASQMTEEAREKRRAEIQAEISVLEQARSSTELTWQAQSQLNAQITALQTESEILRRTFSSTADAAAELAERTATLELQTDNYFKATEATVKAQEALTKAQADAQKVYDDYIAKSLEISTEIAEKEREILADGGEKRADIERKTQESIAKLMRDNGREQFNAIAERDALAAYQAQIKAKDELDDQRKTASDALKEQEKAQAKALASLQSSADKQTRALDNSYRNQAAIAANAQLRAQIDLQNAKSAEIAIAQYGANGMRTIYSNFWGQLTSETVNGVTAILTQTRRLVGGMGGTNMYVNGVNAGSPAAYDLFNVSSTPTTFNRLFDTRLNQTLQISGASSPR